MASIKAKLSSIENFMSNSGSTYSNILSLEYDILSRVESMLVFVNEKLEILTSQLNKARYLYDEIKNKVTYYKQKMDIAYLEMEHYKEEINRIINNPIVTTTTDDEGNEVSIETIDYAALSIASSQLAIVEKEYNYYQEKYQNAYSVFLELSRIMNDIQNTKNTIESVAQFLEGNINEIKKYISFTEDEVEYNTQKINEVITSLNNYISSKPIFMPNGAFYSNFVSNDYSFGGSSSFVSSSGSDFESISSNGLSNEVAPSNTNKGFFKELFAKIFNKDDVTNVYDLLKKVDYKEVEPLTMPRNEKQIISEIGGDDNTEGSCSSLAFAYIGNKAGYNVHDFRGGNSRYAFSKRSSINQIANLDGVKSKTVYGTMDTVCVEELKASMENGKEYYMATGGHAAIVKKENDMYYYLELQSTPENNKWYSLTFTELYGRFDCRDDRKYESSNYLIEVDSLKNNQEFLKILGYINTK